MRVLIISSECNPDWPSLPSVAYKYAMEIANYADVVVATQIRNASGIKKVGFGKAKVVYINSEKIEAPLYKLSIRLRGHSDKSWNIQILFNYLSYLAFERYVWKRFRKDLRNGKFDVVHRMTPMSPATPSYIAKRCPIPFIIGPVNGDLPWPAKLNQTKNREMDLLDRFAAILLKARVVFPYYKSTYNKSSAILASFKHTCDTLPKNLNGKTVNFPEVGIDPKLFNLPIRTRREQTTIVFVGRLVPLKMPEILIEAFRDSELLRSKKLILVGDGAEKRNLESLVQKYNLSDCVELTGQKSRTEVAQIMSESDIFAFPSVHELGGGVVVEAMGCGLACVVADHGGPATLIDEDRGIKIPAVNPDQMRRDFQLQLERLVYDPERIRTLGKAAHLHAMKYYSWEAKARKTMEIYNWTRGENKQKPDYWNPSNNPVPS